MAPARRRGPARSSRRRPTLPRGCPRSTIGAEGLNYRVRDGNGCGPLAMVTGKFLSISLSSRAVGRPATWCSGTYMEKRIPAVKVHPP